MPAPLVRMHARGELINTNILQITWGWSSISNRAALPQR